MGIESILQCDPVVLTALGALALALLVSVRSMLRPVVARAVSGKRP